MILAKQPAVLIVRLIRPGLAELTRAELKHAQAAAAGEEAAQEWEMTVSLEQQPQPDALNVATRCVIAHALGLHAKILARANHQRQQPAAC
jgi:hypothetical protein